MADIKDDRLGQARPVELGNESESSPIRDALMVAAQQRYAKVQEMLKSPPAEDEDAGEFASQLKKLALEIEELTDWTSLELSTMSGEERRQRADTMAEMLMRAGATFAEMKALAGKAGKRPIGRPAAARQIAIMALELKQRPSKPSWTGVTKVVCPCGEKRHNSLCRERVRTAARGLKDLMERMEISAEVGTAAAAERVEQD